MSNLNRLRGIDKPEPRQPGPGEVWSLASGKSKRIVCVMLQPVPVKLSMNENGGPSIHAFRYAVIESDTMFGAPFDVTAIRKTEWKYRAPEFLADSLEAYYEGKAAQERR